MQLIDKWNGNDSRFFHREGGETFGKNAWIDRFREPNQNIAVCLGTLELAPGRYKVSWDCEIIFKEPVCRNPDEGYPVLLSVASGRNVDQIFSRTMHSQVYVCARRDELVFNEGISTGFRVLRQSDVRLEIAAFDDTRTATPTSTGVEEVIVKCMNIYLESSSKIEDSLVVAPY